MSRTHSYTITTVWTGDNGTGTSSYRAYRRDHQLQAAGKLQPIPCSSDPVFRGDPSRYNPEELLVGALSACHMLWVLHLCADAGIVITAYEDAASGTMMENPDGSGEFHEVVLHPRMTITDGSRADEVLHLHHEAHRLCFLARSMRFPVRHEVLVTAS